ncbi:MAG: DegT/DnrJ/EryC1/StrS family aminotransferase [Candidatus Vogelbacteria bacterium]|nr:DegT/DnrJ/EryC1/StrS family aminotransferase [Candidatus Vogelbacteria bacterium]
MKSKKNKDKYIIFGAPAIEDAEIKEVVKTLRSGWLGTGPKVAQFENDICNYVGAQHGVALNSCTAGLHMSLLACGIGPGDEVITTPMTFCATANTIIHAGGTPVFVDVDIDTMNIDVSKIEKAITKKTKVILPVHMAGRPCNMDEIMRIARKIGSIADLTCFSFYVTKNIVTGEGGTVTTNNKEFSDQIKVYGLHGMSKDAWKRYSDDGYKHYDVIFPGFKYNMMDIQASIGIHQLKRIDKYAKVREKIWDYYMQELHLRGIGAGVHFNPVHLYGYYRDKFGYKEGDYPNAEFIGRRTVSLPLSAKLTMQDAKRIVAAIKEILKRKK